MSVRPGRRGRPREKSEKHRAGSTIELSVGDASLRGAVREPHDPPVGGAEHDRVERQESYVKDFRPLALGTIELPAGRGTLTLRALEIPGSEVMEFRTMMLRRVGDRGEGEGGR